MGNLTRKSARSEDVTPPPLQGMVMGTRCHAWVLWSPPQGFALRRGVKRYPEPTAHGPEACELHTRAEAVDTGCQRDIPVL